MTHINLSGASIETGFVKSFKKFEAFAKAMDDKIPDWVGEERAKLLKKVWNLANEIEEKAEKEIPIENIKDIPIPEAVKTETKAEETKAEDSAEKES
jgi:hypothetical protein